MSSILLISSISFSMGWLSSDSAKFRACDSKVLVFPTLATNLEPLKGDADILQLLAVRNLQRYWMAPKPLIGAFATPIHTVRLAGSLVANFVNCLNEIHAPLAKQADLYNRESLRGASELLPVACCLSPHAWARSAAYTFSDVTGTSNSLTPQASATALAMAAGGVTLACSPMPLAS